MVQVCGELSSDRSDETLVSEAQAGSRVAFVDLVSRYESLVFRLATRMCRNPADAEDVCQETFRLAFKGLGTFQGRSRFSTWLYRIATNEALMRRRVARRSVALSLELVAPPGRWPATNGGASHVERADDLLQRKVMTERVRAALAQLDDAQRAAVVLRDLEELSADEAARVLGVSTDTVRQRAHRGRLKLRELLGDVVHPQG